MLTIVLALAFSMEQADLGVVQSLYGMSERMRSFPCNFNRTICSALYED